MEFLVNGNKNVNAKGNVHVNENQMLFSFESLAVLLSWMHLTSRTFKRGSRRRTRPQEGSNDGGDGNENGKKAIGLLSKTTT